MSKKLLMALFAFGQTIAYAQNEMVTLTPISDTTPKVINNQMHSMYGANLGRSYSKKMVAKLNNQKIELTQTDKADSVTLWLPTIGESTNLTIQLGKETLVNQCYEPLIPADWGYFKNGTIHIIQSSHQDIAWMNTIDSCKTERINEIIVPALKIMDESDSFKFEMEQVLNLMELIETHPEYKEEITKRYKERRFMWGATYNQPYEGLSSGEQLVRQAYYGRKWVMENFEGADDVVANNMDVPGRALQMAQILHKSGINNLYISRMAEGMYNWYSPDGSNILTISPGNYGWASLMWKFFDTDGVTAMHKLHHRTQLWSKYYEDRNIPPHYAILMSCDATKPTDYTKIIEQWNKIVEESGAEIPTLRSTSAEEYFELVRGENTKFDNVVGERPNLWLYIHGPAHYEAISYMREAAVAIPSAESFTTFSMLLSDNIAEYPRAKFDRAWMASIYPDHGWGGKHGEQTDSIFSDSLKCGRDIGLSLLNNSLGNIANKVDTKIDNKIVFNSSSTLRNDKVSVPCDYTYAVVRDQNNEIVPSQMTTNPQGERCVVFIAEQVPAMGYKTYKISQSKKQKSNKSEVEFTNNSYNNKFYKIEFGNGGITSLWDKDLDKEIVCSSKFACGDVLDLGYIGNGAGEFTRIQDPTIGDLTALSSLPTNWQIKEQGDLYTSYYNEQPTTNTTVCQTITIFNTIKRIDFDVTLKDFNGTQNRQYRIAFPLNIMSDRSINYEVPMDISTVGESEMKQQPRGWSWNGTYVHHPADTHPREVQNFISANGNDFGFTLSTPVSVCDWVDPSREEAQYPILQGILLSSHKSCHYLGNWYHQTGTHSFHFSITTHEEGWKNGYLFGTTTNNPLRVVTKQNNGGTLPSSNGFIEISDPFIQLSLIKKADNDNSLIIRLTEMEGVDKNVEVKLSLPINVKKIIRTNLIEQELEEVSHDGSNTLSLKLGHHAIETYKLVF